MKTRDAAAFLHICETTIYRLARTGKIPARKVYSPIRQPWVWEVDEVAILEYLSSRPPKPPKKPGHCVNGHELVGKNVQLREFPDGRVWHRCRVCQRRISRERRERMGKEAYNAMMLAANHNFRDKHPGYNARYMANWRAKRREARTALELLEALTALPTEEPMFAALSPCWAQSVRPLSEFRAVSRTDCLQSADRHIRASRRPS